MNEEMIVLAGGPSAGLQDLLGCRQGVVKSRVGRVGGKSESLDENCSRDYVEALELTFDTYVTNTRELLEYFFQVHDPTTLNRQGSEMGMMFRSAIFYTTDLQQEVAKWTIKDMEATNRWPGPFSTTIEPLSCFWASPPELQDYFAKHQLPNKTHFARPDWVLDDRREAHRAF